MKIINQLIGGPLDGRDSISAFGCYEELRQYSVKSRNGFVLVCYRRIHCCFFGQEAYVYAWSHMNPDDAVEIAVERFYRYTFYVRDSNKVERFRVRIDARDVFQASEVFFRLPWKKGWKVKCVDAPGKI